MQKAFSFFSVVVLLSFLALIVLKIDSQMIEQDTTSIEEVDLEDILEDESEEVEFGLRGLFRLALETSIHPGVKETTFNYHFAIKPSSKKVHLPPPEA